MINQIVIFDIKPEECESFKRALIRDRKNAENVAGCTEMRFFVDNKNPHLFFAYERWENQESIDNYREAPREDKICEQLDRFSQSPVRVLNLGETSPLSVPLEARKNPSPDDDLFIIFFIFKIREGYRDRLLKQFETHVAETRKEEGCLLFDFYTVKEEGDTLAVYEHWRNESAVWDIHFKQPYSEVTGH